MFLRLGLISRSKTSASILLAAATFALGLIIGSTTNPVRAGRSEVQLPVPSALSANWSAVRLAHPAEVLRVIDGDTFEARINLWPGLEVTTRVRLRGIDAPELRAHCDDERIKAEAARDAL